MANNTRCLVAALICFTLSPVYAGVCVNVHGGNGEYCMQFSKEDQRTASKFGLRLGESLDHVWQRLVRNGWSVDRERLEAYGDAAKGDLECGQGRDPVCSTYFKKNGKSIQLDFSEANVGTPLIGIDTELP
jgi:hypothetical protein